MALKLRRGTEANRTSITPAEGELIYITDTKKLYSGDGTTAGGVLVTGGGADIPGITDNTTAGAVLTLGDLVIAIDADLSITGYEITGDGDIDITGNITASGAGTGIITASSFVGDVTGNVTGNASGAHTGTFDGDMTGSVFGNDSTVIVDGNNNTLHGNLKDVNSISYATPLDISNETTGVVSTTYLSNTGEAAYLKIRRTDAGTAPDQNVGLLAWDQVDDTGTKTYVSFAGWHSGLYIGTASDGTTYNATNYVGITDGNMALGDYTPAAGLRLDVRGNVKATGFIQTGSFTTAERDALTGAEGMIIYNSTTNQLESYENSAWGATGGAGGGSIGNFTFASSIVDTDDSSGIVITPAVTMSSDLTVENDLVVSNTVTAGKFVSTGTETPEISAGANLNLTAGNAVVITSSPLRMASFTTTERNALAAQNGDIIYNTTDNKFQGYENGAWANLI